MREWECLALRHVKWYVLGIALHAQHNTTITLHTPHHHAHTRTTRKQACLVINSATQYYAFAATTGACFCSTMLQSCLVNAAYNTYTLTPGSC